MSIGAHSAKSKLLFLRAKKAKGWPHPNCPLLLTHVNSWILFGTLILRAWAKSRSKSVLTTYQDEPGSVSWAPIHDKDISNIQRTQEIPSNLALYPSKHLVSCKQNLPEAICTVSFVGLKRCVPETFKSISNFTSPAHICRLNSTHLSEAKGGLHIYWQKSAFSLMVSWTEGNYGKGWQFNSYYGDSIMTARLKISFIYHHWAREHDNEWVNYTSIWGWYYPSAALIN